MKWRITLFALLGGSCLSCRSDVTIDLGSKERLVALYSYPNTGHSNQTLEDTIGIWLNSSLSRDGIAGAEASIVNNGGAYAAQITGGDPAMLAAFAADYGEFLKIGDLGESAYQAFAAGGGCDPNWQFLLPHGEAMENSKTLELMNFPPVTLLATQDYLKSKTTARWKELLSKNGAQQGELDQYSAILDIVPVAAPAGDGTKLTNAGVYGGPFNSYTMPLLELWGKMPNSTARKPMLALGLDPRKWLQQNFSVNVGVLQVATITLPDGSKMPVLASNHPSFFYYAIHKYTTGPNQVWENFTAGLTTLRQDVVAACWQVEMGENPSADPAAALADATAKWKAQDAEVQQLVVSEGGFNGIPPDPNGAAAKVVHIEADLKAAANDLKARWMLDL